MSMQHIIPPSADTSDIKGLLGDVDGNKWNDWVTPSGSLVPIPSTYPSINNAGYSYCVDHWRVPSVADSLFTYEAGLSFASIAACGPGTWGGVASRMLNIPSEKELSRAEENIFEDDVIIQIRDICGEDDSCFD